MKNTNETNEDFYYCHDDDPYTYECLEYVRCEQCPYYYADIEEEN